MTRRARREAGKPAGAELSRTYEGPDVLTALLARAGSPLGADEVAERFRRAQAGREERSDVIPTLFPNEPQFSSGDEARRLYGNLFALWDRVRSGLSIADDAPAVEPEPAPAHDALPARGGAIGRQLTPGLIESVWKHLDRLPEREARRLHDRFENAQPDLVAWLDALPLPDEAMPAAQDLVFETWAMFDVAYGDRVHRVEFRELRALESEPPPLEATQSALATYVGEALDLLAEEDPSLGAALRAQVERAVAAVAQALGDALAAQDDA